jgi:lysophospholipase L1-like esterase
MTATILDSNTDPSFANNSQDPETKTQRPKPKFQHLAPLFLPLVVLSGSIVASGSCGTQGVFVLAPKRAASFAPNPSFGAPYQIEAFAPASEPVSQPVVAIKKNRPSFDPLVPYDPSAPAKIEDPYNSLDLFFESLRRAEAKRPDGRVAIVQFGDSHTVADFGTSKLRRLMQARFGDAGRGFVLPGRPFRGYYQRDLFSWSEGKWSVENGFRMGVGAHEPFGIGGFRSIAESSQAVAFVGTCRDKDCPSGGLASRFEVFYHVTPQGGTLRLYLDEEPKDTIDTRENYSREETLGGYWSTEVAEGSHQLTLRPSGNGPVELFGVVMERNAPGVIVDAMGVGGTQAWHLAHWDWSFIGEHLRRRRPSLVIIAYGTNESANDFTTREKIVKTYSDTIAKVKEAMPDVPVLVVGPIDRSVREQSNCDRYSKGNIIAASIPEGCLWKTPLLLSEIVSGEREAALLSGVAFFDAFRAMGGEGSMAQWAKQSPQLGQRDHTHLTKDGYEFNANLLYEALMTSYEEYLLSAPPL